MSSSNFSSNVKPLWVGCFVGWACWWGWGWKDGFCLINESLLVGGLLYEDDGPSLVSSSSCQPIVRRINDNESCVTAFRNVSELLLTINFIFEH